MKKSKEIRMSLTLDEVTTAVKDYILKNQFIDQANNIKITPKFDSKPVFGGIFNGLDVSAVIYFDNGDLNP